MAVQRALVASLVLVAACSPAKPEPLRSAMTHRPVARMMAPQIAWRDGRFDTSALPAIARDAAIVILPLVDGDGGRGYPNLRVEVRNLADRPITNMQIMKSNEFETLVPDAVHATPELESRLAIVNRELADLAMEHVLVTMKESAPPPDLAIDFAARGWLAPSGPRCAQCPPCENPPYVAALYRAEGVDPIVLRIEFKGTDICWEPGPQYHVIARKDASLTSSAGK